jgi:hypothetical protein
MEQTSRPVRKSFLPRFFRATAKKVNLNMTPFRLWQEDRPSEAAPTVPWKS